MLFAPPPNKKSWLRADSRSILDQSIHYLIKYFQCSVPAKKLKYCHGQHYRNKQHRDSRSHFFRLQHRSCYKIFESGSASGPDILNIWESDSCSDFGDNDRSNPNLPMFLPKKWPHRLLVLPKWKSDSGSGSGLKKKYDSLSGSGSERKTQNPAGADSSTPDPAPRLKQHRRENNEKLNLETLYRYFAPSI